MLNLKKKAELSINIIVVTVIALVVLAVIVFLVLRSSGNYSDSTACLEKGGICKAYGSQCTEIIVLDKPYPCGEGSTKRCCEPLS